MMYSLPCLLCREGKPNLSQSPTNLGCAGEELVSTQSLRVTPERPLWPYDALIPSLYGQVNAPCAGRTAPKKRSRLLLSGDRTFASWTSGLGVPSRSCECNGCMPVGSVTEQFHCCPSALLRCFDQLE